MKIFIILQQAFFLHLVGEKCIQFHKIRIQREKREGEGERDKRRRRGKRQQKGRKLGRRKREAEEGESGENSTMVNIKHTKNFKQ